MHLWYVSTPFEVVRVFDAISEEDDEDGGTLDRPRPLVAVILDMRFGLSMLRVVGMWIGQGMRVRERGI